MKCQLVALDLDGTVLHPSGELIHPVDATAIQACVKHGIQVVLTSARPPRSMKPHWAYLNLASHGIAYNGGLVWNFSEAHAVKGWYFTKDKLSLALDLIERADDAFVWLEAQDHWIAEYPDSQQVQIHTRRGGRPPIVGNVRRWSDRPINKLIVYGAGHLALIEPLRKLGLDIASYSYPDITEARPSGVDKGKAVTWLCQYLNIPMCYTACIGDDSNDLPMFNVTGLSIAMGNAADAIKQAANVVTLSIDEHGVAAALNQYILA